MADSIADLVKSQSPSAAQIGLRALAPLVPGVISLFSKDRSRSHAKRAEQLERTNREKKYGFGMANLARSEGELLRKQERAPSSIKAKFAGIGASGGSQEAEALRDQDHAFQVRMDVLNQQRAELRWGKQYGDEVRSLQDSMRELESANAKINALLQTGIFVGDAALGGAGGASPPSPTADTIFELK